MILSLDQLKKRIKEYGTCTIYFYDREPEIGESLKDLKKRLIFSKADADKQIERLDELSKEFPILLYLKVTKSVTGGANQGFEVKADLGAVDAEILNGTESRVYQTPEQIEKRLREQILKEIEEKKKNEELDLRIQELKEEQQKIATMGGKLMFFVEQFITNIMAAKQTNTNTETMQGVKNNPDQLNEALNYLIECLGEEGIIKLAQKVKEQPSLITMVKNFIN